MGLAVRQSQKGKPFGVWLGHWRGCSVKKVKVSSYIKKARSFIAQYPVLRTVQSALHFTSLADLFTQTPFRLLLEASSHMLQLIRESRSFTYPPLSIAILIYTAE